MKDRAKVICHMMTTIDGKIDVEFEPSADYDKVGDEYDRLLLSYGQAYGLGRATCQSDLETDLSKYKGVPATYEDKRRRTRNRPAVIPRGRSSASPSTAGASFGGKTTSWTAPVGGCPSSKRSPRSARQSSSPT